jgi:hypothetical protein
VLHPSPITTTPFIRSDPSTGRMGSTAVWSTCSLSPNPCVYRAQAITAASVARTNSRARLRSGSIWPLVSALIRIPVHFYVSRMWNQPIELTDEANMAATSS